MVIEVTGVAQKAAWQAEVLPPVEEVRPGLWSMPVPIPESPLRYVLVHVLASRDGLVVVDAGWECEPGWTALVDGLARLGAAPADVRGIVVTHMHPDHFGLVPRLRAASGAWLAMHEADAELVTDRPDDHVVRESRRQLTELGMPCDVHHGAGRYPGPRLAPSERPEFLLDDGDLVPVPGWSLRAIHTPGHTPGHLCFLEERHRLLLTGDHVLPRISPTVTVQPAESPDPLRAYLSSLAKIRDLAVEEVLPAHEYRFSGLRERADDLMGHHDERLDGIAAAVTAAPGSSGYEIAARLSWSRRFDGLNAMHRRMATRETLAHLVVLADRGAVRAERDAEVTTWHPANG